MAQVAIYPQQVPVDRDPDVVHSGAGGSFAAASAGQATAMSPPMSRAASGIDNDELSVLLDLVQDGVVSRRQLIALGATDDDIERLVRRKELHRRHPGVYVDHNGPLTRSQREWVAVHAHWPAALTRESALPGPPPPGAVHVAIDLRRTVKPVPGVVAHRTAALADRVDWGRSPPRMRLEHAVIDVASARITDPLAAFHVLADVVQTRRTSATAVAEVLRGRRVPGKALLLDLLMDLALGACSVLELEYLVSVERAHGLPEGSRQRRGATGGRTAYRDVSYDDFGLLIELDGRAFHDSARARDADAERDLEAAATQGAITVRLTYGQVFGNPCRTARQVASLLRARGWAGSATTCPRCR